jgi:hypothetical protein
LKRLQAVLQNYQRALEENKHPSVALAKEMQAEKDMLFNAVQEVIARKQPPDHDVKPQYLKRDGVVPSYHQSLEDSLSHISLILILSVDFLQELICKLPLSLSRQRC